MGNFRNCCGLALHTWPGDARATEDFAQTSQGRPLGPTLTGRAVLQFSQMAGANL